MYEVMTLVTCTGTRVAGGWLRLGGALGWLKPDLEAITATDTGAEDHWLLEVDLDTECQAPGFVEAGLPGAGGCRLWLFLTVAVGCPGGFVLGGGTHADGGVWPDGVEPVHPLGGGDLDGVDVLPRALVTDQLGLVQGVQSLGQGEAERRSPFDPTEATASQSDRACP